MDPLGVNTEDPMGKKASVVFVNLSTSGKPTSARTERKKVFPAEDL